MLWHLLKFNVILFTIIPGKLSPVFSSLVFFIHLLTKNKSPCIIPDKKSLKSPYELKRTAMSFILPPQK